MRAPLVLIALTATLGGCFSWHPVTTTPPARASLEAVLTSEGSATLIAQIGPNAASILGTLTAVRGDTIELAIAEVRTTGGLTYYLKGSSVTLVPAQLAQLRMRVLDRRRTIVAATIGVVGAAALAGGVRALSGGSENGGGGGVTPAARPPE